MREYTAKEAAKMLGIDDQQFFYRRRKKALPFREIGSGKSKRYIMDEGKGQAHIKEESKRENLKDLKLSAEIKKLYQGLYEKRLEIARHVAEIMNTEILLPFIADMKSVISPELNKLSEETREKWNRTLTTGLDERLPAFTESIREMLLK